MTDTGGWGPPPEPTPGAPPQPAPAPPPAWQQPAPHQAPPGYMPWAAPPPTAMPPPPPKRNTGAIIAAVVGGLAVMGVLLAVGLAVSGDDDEPEVSADVDEALEDFEQLAEDGVLNDAAYNMDIGPDWIKEEQSEEFDLWYVGNDGAAFGDLINVFTQPYMVTGLERYMSESVDSAGGFVNDFELVEPIDIVEGSNGQELGVMHYRGSNNGADQMEFLAYVHLEDGAAAVATMGATPDRFERVRAAVEPYFLTLEVAN